MKWVDKSCSGCIFNIKRDKQCRRFPPVNIQYSDGKHAAYPVIEPWSNACAEYKETE